MGGKGDKTSSTESTIPSWLEAAFKPLLVNATKSMGDFAAQGQNVLQGKAPQGATSSPGSSGGASGGAPRIDPSTLAALFGGGGAGAGGGGEPALRTNRK